MIRKRFVVFIGCLIAMVAVGYKVLFVDNLTVSSNLEPTKSQLNREFDVKSREDNESTEQYGHLLKKITHLNKEVAILKYKVAMVMKNNRTQVTVADSVEPITQPETPKLSAQEYMETIEYETGVLAKQQDQHQRYIEDIDASFESEAIDNEWSSDTTGAIQQALEKTELEGTSIVGVQCKSTLCRVEVEHENISEASEFSLWFPNFIVEDLPNITIDQNDSDDGYSNTVVYLARAGYELPGE